MRNETMKKLIFFSTVIGIFLLGGCPNPFSMTKVLSGDLNLEERIFYRAETLLRKGKIPEAREDFNRVLRMNPEHPGVIFNLAKMEIENGNLEKAEILLRKVENDPEYGIPARKIMADQKIARFAKKNLQAIEAYIEGGAYDQALKECLEAIKHDPENPELLFHAAFSAIMAGERKQAEWALKKLQTISPKHKDLADLEFFFCGWFSRETDLENSLSYLLGIKNRKLLPFAIRKKIGEILQKADFPDDQEKFLLSEIESDKTNGRYWEVRLAQFYLNKGFYEKALELLEKKPLESVVDNQIYLDLLSKSGQEMKAMAVVRDLIDRWPDDQQLRNFFMESFISYVKKNGFIPRKRNPADENPAKLAGKEVDRLVEKISTGVSDPTSFLLGARISIMLNRFEDACALVNAAKKLNFDEKSRDVGIETARELVSSGMKAEAIELLESIRAKLPEDFAVKVGLAEFYFQEKKFQKAVELLKNTSKEDLKSYKAFTVLVESLAAGGAPEEARKMVLERLDEPDLPAILVTPFRNLANKFAAYVVAEK